MGEIAHVDPDRLHRVADTFSGAAADVEGMRAPVLDPAALPGSAVAAVAVADLVAGQLSALSAGLDGWADAARSTVDAFRKADAANGERFTPR
jgi:hypothetical protein